VLARRWGTTNATYGPGTNATYGPGIMIGFAAKEGIDINKLKINGRFMTDNEIFRTFPVPPPFNMYGTPAGHLALYKPFGGTLEPIRTMPPENNSCKII